MDRTFIVVNPVSSQGKGLKEFERIKGLLENLPQTPTYAFSEYPTHAIELTKNAVSGGFTRIISFGGDGTHNEVLNGIIKGAEALFKKSFFELSDEEKNKLPALGIVSVGSGNDFRRSLNIPKDIEASLKIALLNPYRFIDVGYFEYKDFLGNLTSRYFLNILSGGFSGVVTDKANKGKKSILRGFTYLYALISTLLFLTIPEGILKHKKETINGKFFEFVIANGKFFGGGMLVSPKANLEDGLLNISLFKNYTGLEILFKVYKLFNGTILSEKKLYHDFVKEVFVKTEPKSLIEADGEVLGYTPVKVKVVEKAVKVVV